MQINPLSSVSTGGIQSNSTYDAANAAAEHAKFSETLRSMQRKADSAISGEEADALKKQQELKEACKGFEAMFLNMMLREMRKTVPKDELFGDSNAMDIYRDMHDTELMQQVANSGGIGIADMMYRQLSPQIERQLAAARSATQESN